MLGGAGGLAICSVVDFVGGGGVYDLLSYHHPVATPRSSPFFVLGTSTPFSWAWGMV